MDAMRLLLKYFPGVQFASLRNFDRCNVYFYDDPCMREEALKLILENAKNIVEWVNEDDYFSNSRTVDEVFMLANYGARFTGEKIYDLCDFCRSCYIKPSLFQTYCALCVCGLWPLCREYGLIDENLRRNFDICMVRFRKGTFIRIIMQCGYKTVFCRDQTNLSNDDDFEEEIKHFKELYSSQPLSLQRLAANVIRKELYPNAVVGSRVLGQVQPGEKSSILPRKLASYITF